MKLYIRKCWCRTSYSVKWFYTK